MRLRRSVFVIVFVGAVLSSFVVTAIAEHSGISPAKPGEPTYLLSSFGMGETGHSDREGTYVDVSFDAAWSEATFPGYAECEVRVLDDRGTVIGSQYFRYASYRPGADHVSTSISIETAQVASSASSAEGDCSAATKPSTSAGYELTDPSVSSSKTLPGDSEAGATGPTLTFIAKWSTSEPPMLQSCAVNLVLLDGSSASYPFEISLGNGDKGTVLLPPALDGSVPGSIVCHDFDGSDQA